MNRGRAFARQADVATAASVWTSDYEVADDNAAGTLDFMAADDQPASRKQIDLMADDGKAVSEKTPNTKAADVDDNDDDKEAPYDFTEHFKRLLAEQTDELQRSIRS